MPGYIRGARGALEYDVKARKLLVDAPRFPPQSASGKENGNGKPPKDPKPPKPSKPGQTENISPPPPTAPAFLPAISPSPSPIPPSPPQIASTTPPSPIQFAPLPSISASPSPNPPSPPQIASANPPLPTFAAPLRPISASPSLSRPSPPQIASTSPPLPTPITPLPAVSPSQSPIRHPPPRIASKPPPSPTPVAHPVPSALFAPAPPGDSVSRAPVPSAGGGGTNYTPIIVAVVLAVVLVGAILGFIACWQRRKATAVTNNVPPTGGPVESGKKSWGAMASGSQPATPGERQSQLMTVAPSVSATVDSLSEGSRHSPRGGGVFGGAGGGGWGAGGAVFSPQEIKTATNNFSDDNFLGMGGYGRVYKGVTAGGREIAVKVLKDSGADGEREFTSEAQIISHVHHRNLVALYGCCVLKGERMLILEYVTGGTLLQNLERNLEWSTRVRVILGVARGLAYLHHDCDPRIFHRDIKAENILIDSQQEAKVADFGLAKLAPDTYTHLTTRVMGSPGYVAPEYITSGQMTEKSDVFSFGVVVLEAISGLKANDREQPKGHKCLWKRAQRLIDQNRMQEMIDPRLNGRFDEESMVRMMETAAYCTREAASRRPTMGEVVQMLQGHESKALRILRGTEPGGSGRESAGSGSSSVDGGSRSPEPNSFTVSGHTRGSTSGSPNLTTISSTTPRSAASPTPTRGPPSHPTHSSEFNPIGSLYPQQPDFRPPPGFASQQFEVYGSGGYNTSERGSGSVSYAQRMPPMTSADFSSYAPSSHASSGEVKSFGVDHRATTTSGQVVFTSEFSLPEKTERLDVGR